MTLKPIGMKGQKFTWHFFAAFREVIRGASFARWARGNRMRGRAHKGDVLTSSTHFDFWGGEGRRGVRPQTSQSLASSGDRLDSIPTSIRFLQTDRSGWIRNNAIIMSAFIASWQVESCRRTMDLSDTVTGCKSSYPTSSHLTSHNLNYLD